MFSFTKRLLAFCLLAGIGHEAVAQVASSIPRFPADTDTVTIIFDATQGNGALAGVNPPIYAHTGVITNLSTGPSDWRFVQGTWGQASPNTLMTPLGNNKYSITYVPRSFYNVPAAQTIQSLAFVFRNTTGSIVGREANGSDIYVPIYPAGQLHSRIFSPGINQQLVQPGTSLPFFGAASQVCSLRLYVNGALVQAALSDTLTSNLSFPAAGNYDIVFEADNGSVQRADTFNMVALSPNPILPLPNNVQEGINYINDSTVTLVLYAPHKSYVFAVGDFNAWELDLNYLMNQTPDSNWFWVTINQLTPGEEYAYQYFIDGQIKVADPYTHKVLDPSNDRFILPSTYPNLKPYPEGKTTGIVSVFQTAQPAYNWQTTNYVRPDQSKLVIYELLVRDFIADQRYLSIIDSLDYFERLGINCIELMPIMEFEGNNSWGYNTSFALAADKAYGTANDLRAFIDSCHARGISVVLDMVLNHAFGQSPLVQMWWDGNTVAANSPYFNPVAKHDFNVGFDFNHESEATKRYVNRVVRYWLEEFKFDGFRFDLSKGFTQKNTLGNVGAWGNYDSSRVELWKAISDTIWAISPDAYVILEHFADNSEERVLAAYGMMLWGNLNHNFNEGTMGFMSNSNFSWGSYKNRGWSQPNLITYAESHDEERLMYRNLTFGAQSSTYNTRNLQTALKRMELAATFLYAIPGPKMIWQFGELGYDFSINRCPGGGINNNCRTDPKPIRWDYFVNPERRYLYNIYAAMAKLRTQEAAFSTDSFFISFGGSFKQIRLIHPDMNVVLAGNWATSSIQGSTIFPTTGWWYDYFSGDSIQITNTTTVIEMQAGEYRLFTSKRLAAPDLALNTQDNLFSPAGSLRIYPNPTSNSVNIKITDLQPFQPSWLEVVDLQGRLVQRLTVHSESSEAVVHWNLMNQAGQRVAPGLYFIRDAKGRNAKLMVQ